MTNIITETHRKGKMPKKARHISTQNIIKSFMEEVNIKKMLRLLKYEKQNYVGPK